MENFFKIRAEKQEHIINAAFAAFGRQGYKKASVADIADAAGIAKGMITYYFGSKKNLYLHLCEIGQKILMEKIEQHFNQNITDFFDKIRMGTEIKVAVIKECPSLLQFFVSMLAERDEDVVEDIKEIVDKNTMLGSQILMINTDFFKFREGIDPQIVGKFINWAGNGLMMDLQLLENADKFEEFAEEFYKLLDLMKIMFYKEGEAHVKS